MERVNWQRVRDILISVICIGIIIWAVSSILGEVLHAVVLLLLAMAVAFLITPAADYLARYMPRVLATLLVYVIVLVMLGGIAYALVFSFIQQVVVLSNTVTTYFINLPQTYNSVLNFLHEQGIPQANIDDALSQIRTSAIDFAQTLAANALNIVFSVTDTIINIFVVVVISFYLTMDGKRIRESIIGIVPERALPHVRMFEDALNRVVGNYLRGQLTLAVIIGLMAGIGCLLPFMGLADYALIIGVLAFLFETIPMVGPTLSSIPAILISLLLPDPFPRTFYVVAYFICIQVLENNILGPRIVGHAVGLHPVASILALIIGAQLFGAFGALLATPLVGAAWVVIVSIYHTLRGETADQMLAHRRRAWEIRTPTGKLLRQRNRQLRYREGREKHENASNDENENSPRADAVTRESEAD
ncbi:MAG TPA: AI-2E family transporter [Ktedonobacteraceae bacterium]|nr:AI-2E family transporter [Ktedonobacteraceae bacterium]